MNLIFVKMKRPCLFTPSDTTGEKDFEEFFTENETLDMDRFENLGVIKNEANFDNTLLNDFEERIDAMKKNLSWNKEEIVEEFLKLLPNFEYEDKKKYLDGKM